LEAALIQQQTPARSVQLFVMREETVTPDVHNAQRLG
jgi:hypothetical protein